MACLTGAVLRTGGNVTVKGRDFSLLGGDIGGYFQSASGQELIAAGTISLQNTGVVKVKAGTAVVDGAKGPSDTNLYPSGSGARLQGGTVNIGSASTPADNPTLLIVEGGSNDVGVASSNTSNPAIEFNQANAVVRSSTRFSSVSFETRNCSSAFFRSLRSRVTFPNPTSFPLVSTILVITIRAQNRDPSLRKRQPSSS